LYPSSNGYNSFMDRDTGSIGGIAHPMEPTRQLFYASILMDFLAVVLSLLISAPVALGVCIYMLCSRLYSYRGIRLKRFPILGYLTVIINQGALVFVIVYCAATGHPWWQAPWLAVAAAAFLIGGFYPITQVYQHKADAADGVKTISMLLGVRGTFIFCGIMYTLAFGMLFFIYQSRQQLSDFLVLQLFFLPVIFFFIRWLLAVWRNPAAAGFRQTMQMNWLAASCTNLAFITLIIKHAIG
jgi:1,4-dihydroxy-2-naphthoate polyprenyltransferase